MSQDLVIQVHDAGTLDWSVIDRESGNTLRSGQAGKDEAPDIADRSGIDRTLCILPGERVFLTRINLPARSEREARQAAPFMVEDELAASLEETRIIPGARAADGKRWIMAAENDWVEALQQRLEPVLVRPVYTMADYQAAADQEAALTLFDRRGDVLFWYGQSAQQDGTAFGGAVDPDLFGQIAHAIVHGASGGDVAVSSSLGLTGAAFRAVSREDLAGRARRMDDADLGDLPPLFGERWLSTLDWSVVLKPLRYTGALAAGLLIAFGALLGSEAMYYRLQADRFDAASVAVFRSAVPEVTRRVIPAEAERILGDRIAALGGGETSSFLLHVTALSELTAGNERVRIEGIRFDQARAELRVSALYTDFADFDALSAEAARLGIGLEDNGAREGEAGLEGEFVLRLR
ncbi:type II secretion system protein GspL [Maricaulis sp.]|uniref:type II secretion system protein GspL n=1 Tax=Maricaulis sp. TaxID=1486257 RepID=UPI002638DECE|nr:type II secretion system protein GspL [Maricaulis sp.]